MVSQCVCGLIIGPAKPDHEVKSMQVVLAALEVPVTSLCADPAGAAMTLASGCCLQKQTLLPGGMDQDRNTASLVKHSLDSPCMAPAAADDEGLLYNG